MGVGTTLAGRRWMCGRSILLRGSRLPCCRGWRCWRQSLEDGSKGGCMLTGSAQGGDQRRQGRRRGGDVGAQLQGFWGQRGCGLRIQG
eukprot:scaffold96882_cov16-Tisochrysis_lutea.AAC.2